MIDGLTITIVGMLTVFALLALLVVSMALLRLAVSRFPGPGTALSGGASGGYADAGDTARVAAIVAAIQSPNTDAVHRGGREVAAGEQTSSRAAGARDE